MIICPNCNHTNPEGASNCEYCFTTLPMTIECPQCSHPVQDDAAFCGNCGYNLQIKTSNTMPSESNSIPKPESTTLPPVIPQEVTIATGPVLLHVQTNQEIKILADLRVLHIGRPNDQIPPDLDVSPLPDSDIVSRIHADIRQEDDGYYYLEDMGSANGTYVNGQRLLQGDRHRLQTGDRFCLGKEDKVSFIFSLP
ncbi:FHA domain-containing protein [Gloeocapsa sp. PCC 73106]|uniref:FHA domain-containing protein n=1 Tax=Gloeocapsa sp. PCC 73106 TaxID=102232 RepID=UPI0002AC5963|nr:FHA domain-containing protein [Gloeocapsa sp. PCC 73106]ELR97673.1 FHA domain-containing protein [Gloeocapsa sp. PCC 73106]